MTFDRSHLSRASVASAGLFALALVFSEPIQAQLAPPPPPPRSAAATLGGTTSGSTSAPTPTAAPTATPASTATPTSASAPAASQPVPAPASAPALAPATATPAASPVPVTANVPVAAEQGEVAASFKTEVALVPVNAVVRDRKGRIVRNLSRHDFQVFERGQRREIIDFMVSDQGPVSVAVLFDASGSMRLATNMQGGQVAAGQILSMLTPGTDEVALYSFDKKIREEVGFTRDPERVRAGLGRLRGHGQTSLYDAIAQAAQRLADRPSPRRAVVVITDGVDNASQLTAEEVTALASRIDVPLYVIAVVSPLDHPGEDLAVSSRAKSPAGTQLASLAAGTGGALSIVSQPAHANAAARELIAELRHQYVLAFESALTPGWHALDIKTPKRDLKVRARTGYWAKS